MPARDEQRTRSAYDQVADSYADTFPGTQPEQPVELAMIDLFAQLLTEPRRVLDAGCGAGRMLPQLAMRGCSPQGVDLSPEMVRRAHQDHPESPVVVGSLTALPHGDGRFDGAFSWYSTIHNPDGDLPVMVAELTRVVVPGGLVLIAFQSGQGAREVGQGFRRRGHDIELVRHHRPVGQVVDALTGAGCEVVARMEREAVAPERDGQAVVIGRRVR